MSITINTDDGISSIFDGCDGAAMDKEAPTRLPAVIFHAAKTSLQAHFESVDWPLNKNPAKGGSVF